MTANPVVGLPLTPGHPLSYSTKRNAESVEYVAATREGRRRKPPTYCGDCPGWHLADAVAPTPDRVQPKAAPQ